MLYNVLIRAEHVRSFQLKKNKQTNIKTERVPYKRYTCINILRLHDMGVTLKPSYKYHKYMLITHVLLFLSNFINCTD